MTWRSGAAAPLHGSRRRGAREDELTSASDLKPWSHWAAGASVDRLVLLIAWSYEELNGRDLAGSTCLSRRHRAELTQPPDFLTIVKWTELGCGGPGGRTE